MDQPGKVASPARGELRIWSRETEPEFIGSHNCVPMAFTAESTPAQGRASSPRGSSNNGCCHFAGHHEPINVRLSFPTPTIGMKWL